MNELMNECTNKRNVWNETENKFQFVCPLISTTKNSFTNIAWQIANKNSIKNYNHV